MAAGQMLAAELWELPPIRYGETEPKDAVAALARDLASGAKRLEGETELERLKFVLKVLAVPEESQVLVFSKTSHQNPRIGPRTPRALFFSENAYVGFVLGGEIEVVVPDPVLGPVFYLVGRGDGGGVKIERDVANCLSCHATSATEGVPGLLVRSVFPDEMGSPILTLGRNLVNHDTPLSERWGGYYVTGVSSLPHLGNRTYQPEADTEAKPSRLEKLTREFDTTRYPRPYSDIVALMVLEHQCRMHNLFTAASMQYRRSFLLGRLLDAEADPDAGGAGRVADSAAAEIVEWMFFKDEAATGDEIEGDEGFQKMFEARFPRSASGQSLADFRLYDRLFRNRCSYMIYSQAFRDLPPRVKSAVLTKMKKVLEGADPSVDWLSAGERKRIGEILAETLPEWGE